MTKAERGGEGAPLRVGTHAAGGDAAVRVGRIEFVNCFPLYHHLERELAARGVAATIVEGDPATLNRMLVAGEIDVALPSSIHFARHADVLTLLPRVSISAFGAVDSVQLFTQVPPADVRRIAVTAKSATSVCLLRVLCAAWGITPEIGVRQGPLSRVMAEYDALLLIGDEALYVLRTEVFPEHIDLGEAWHALTGLPMVFAVSAARRDFAAARPQVAAAVGAALLASRDECRAHPDETAAAAALRYDFSQAYLREYFERLKFGFEPAYRAGLQEFYRRAAAIGQLDAVPDLAAVTPADEQASAAAPGADQQSADQPGAVGAPPAAPGAPASPSAAPPALAFRPAEPSDAAAVAAAIDAWWPGRHIVHGVVPQLFEHLGDTSLIAEEDGVMVGFLAGFLSQREPDAGYIHYAGVRPDRRGGGIGAELYRRFAALCRARGRRRVLAETGAWNKPSLAFHRRVGFAFLPGDMTLEGLPVVRDTTGMGFDYVRLEWRLDDEGRA